MSPDEARSDLKKQVGLLWTWWQGDALPRLPLPAAFVVERSEDIQLLVDVMRLPATEVQEKLLAGHRAYLAHLDATPVAYGWSALNAAAFGSPSVLFWVPAKNRYLYHFVTLPAWRGLGLYPRLLQGILKLESAEIERFWIINQISNTASARGIAKAGFCVACNVYRLTSGGLGLVAAHEIERVQAGAKLLGLPLFDRSVFL